MIKNLIDTDYSTKNLTWQIDVNLNGYEMNNWTMTDTLSPGLTLPFEDGRGFVIQDVTGGVNLDPITDYDFVYNKASGQIDIAFKGNYQSTNHTFKIIYKTKFDTADLNEAGLQIFTNDVSSKWVNKDGSDLTTQDHEEFKPKPEEGADGFKSGKYNAITKTITWTLGINYNMQELGDVTITDPITSNQKYVPGSVKAFIYTIGKDGSIVKGDQVDPSKLTIKYNFVEPSETNGNVLEIKIKDVGTKEQIMFEFETSLEGEVVNASKEYHNKASVNSSKEGDFSIQGDVSIANGGSLIQKSGKQGDDGFLHWTATINPSQSTVYDAKVTDHPSPNQSVDKESVVLYETTVNAAGKITKGEALDPSKYEVSLTTNQETAEQELIVTFKDEKIEKAYILEYTAMLMLEKPSGETASNKIKLEGTNKEVVEEEISKEVGVQASEGGGTAVGQTGALTIRKVDEDAKVLTGATFELWDKKNQQKLREGEVAADGTLLFGKLPYGDYILKEIKAPAGYTIQEDLLAGRKVIVDKTTSTTGNYLDVVNEISKVELVKQAEDGTKLLGAKFKLEFLKEGQWVALQTPTELVTDKDGKLVVKGLVAGKYRFIETQAPTAPKEYVLDKTPIEFEVVTTDAGQTPTVTVGPVINYLGSASFIKSDSATPGKVLAGAQFKIKRVKNGSGAPVNEALPLTFTANAQGVVTMDKLAPGEYEVTETKAPAGYLINTAKFTFTIAQESVGKPAVVTAPNFINYQGSISFIKKAVANDGTTNKVLAGAEFEIKSADGKIVKQATSDSTGKVLFEGLAPGAYTLRETKAALDENGKSYILNTEVVDFTIADKAEGKPATELLKDFLNYKGSIAMIKVNSGGEGLEGAIFTLYTKEDVNNTTSLGDYTSDDLGHISITDLSPGEYKLVETKAPALTETTDYIMNKYPRFFTIEAAQEGKVEVLKLGEYQNFKGKVVINKKSDSGLVLPGAEFDLYILKDGVETKLNPEDQPIVSDENGDLNISDLGPGYYKLIEVKAPTGHIVNTNPIFITVEEEDDDNPINEDAFVFNNYKVPVKFKKTDSQGNALIGATFNIYKAGTDGEKLVPEELVNEEVLTSTTGEYKYDGLGTGFYVLEEITAVPGFLKNTELLKFEVKDQIGKPEELELPDFINYQGELSVIKKADSTDGKVLAGAEFSLTSADGTITKKATSDENGLVTIKELAPGTYTLKETKAAPGYLLNTQEEEVVIPTEAAGKPVLVEFGDFINYQGELSLVKKADGTDGKVLAGAEFSLTSADGTIIKEAISDENGLVTIKELAPGTYTLKETKAAEGYLLNTQEEEIVIPAEAVGKPALIAFGDFINYQGELNVIKKAEGTDGKVLAGAEFSLTSADGTITKVATSDENGLVTIKELAPGTYTLKETKAAEGYLLNTQEEEVVIPAQAVGKPDVVKFGDFINYQGALSLVKKAEGTDGKVLAGAEFSLTSADGTITKEAISDENGLVTIKELAPGTYTLKETKAAEGYLLNTKEEEVVIPAEAAGKPDVVAFGDFINYRGEFSLIKETEDGKVLAEAEFEITSKDGEITRTAISDENGLVTVKDLAPGSYLVKETKAPVGYVLNTTVVEFEILDQAAGKPATVEFGKFINYQGSAELTKVAKDNDKTLLAGAEFKVVDKAGKTIKDNLITDAKGQILVEQLAPGSYYFVETKAPKGYQLDTTKTEFIISEKAEGKPVKLQVTFANTKEPIVPEKPKPGKPSTNNSNGKNKLPKTGETLSNLSAAIGLSLIVVGSSIYRVRKRTR